MLINISSQLQAEAAGCPEESLRPHSLTCVLVYRIDR